VRERERERERWPSKPLFDSINFIQKYLSKFLKLKRKMKNTEKRKKKKVNRHKQAELKYRMAVPYLSEKTRFCRMSDF
jgi:hypothetical protein